MRLCLTLALLLLAQPGASPVFAAGFNEVGDTATDFTLWDQHLVYHSLYDSLGDIIVLCMGKFW